MVDCVLDATVVAFSNSDLALRIPGSPLDRRLSIIEEVAAGVRRIRYNPRLLGEYEAHARTFRNDVIELFFILLESDKAYFVRRNTLCRQDFAKATSQCNWPSHDQHLLAAAKDGVDPSIFVTEVNHAVCASRILRAFHIRVEFVGPE